MMAKKMRMKARVVKKKLQMRKITKKTAKMKMTNGKILQMLIWIEFNQMLKPYNLFSLFPKEKRSSETLDFYSISNCKSKALRSLAS